MTKHWGPLGWITLHSISINYPDIPNSEDKSILKQYMEAFTETISCPSCKMHFSKIFKSYTSRMPNWADSRYNLFLFTARAHNTVNARIDKPRPATIKDCLASLSAATKLTSPKEFRNKYISYLFSNWAREGGGEGYIQSGNVRTMQKISAQYWDVRDNRFEGISFPEGDILTPIVDNSPDRIPRAYYLPPMITQPNAGQNGPIHTTMLLKLSGGKFSLRR